MAERKKDKRTSISFKGWQSTKDALAAIRAVHDVTGEQVLLKGIEAIKKAGRWFTSIPVTLPLLARYDEMKRSSAMSTEELDQEILRRGLESLETELLGDDSLDDPRTMDRLLEALITLCREQDYPPMDAQIEMRLHQVRPGITGAEILEVLNAYHRNRPEDLPTLYVAESLLSSHMDDLRTLHADREAEAHRLQDEVKSLEREIDLSQRWKKWLQDEVDSLSNESYSLRKGVDEKKVTRGKLKE